MRITKLFACALLAIACGQRESKTPPATASGSAPTASGSAAPTASGSAAPTATGSAAPTATGSSAAPIISDALRETICKAEPCGGDMSSITVYRDASGTVKKLYRLYGRCSHNAALYFDPDGTKTETIPEKPIVPGSDEAKAFEAKHQAQVGGLTETDRISCRTGTSTRLAPQ